MAIRSISTDGTELNDFKKLYLEVFPEEERLDFNLLTEKAEEGKGHFLGFFNADEFAGMMYYAEHKEIIYIFYFAIDPRYQSKGYGKLMLEYMFRKFDEHKIILLVEELDTKAENIEQRIRRKNFYLRNGFTDNEQFLTTLGVKFELIHRQGRTASVADYKEVKQYYYGDTV